MAEWDKETEAAFRDCMSSALDEMEALDPTPARVVTPPKMTAKDLAQLIDVAPTEAFQDPTFARTIIDAIRRVVKERDPYTDPDQYDIQMADFARQIERGAELSGLYPKKVLQAIAQPQRSGGNGLYSYTMDDVIAQSKMMQKAFNEVKAASEERARMKRERMAAMKTPIKK